jgi:peptidoglycan/xylan/chitin deacetylase (PgdA/CDA1 family)
MRAIMYHYIQDDDSTPPYGYYHLDITDFRRQLDYFQSNYDIISRKTFIDTIRGDRSPKEEDLVLTFDDGLVDHHKHALPELIDRGLWGLFYVPAGPYLNDMILDVHRIHALLGAHGGAVVSEALTDIVTETMISNDHREQFNSVVYQKQNNQTGVEHTKRLLNYYIDDKVRSDVLDTLEKQLSDNLTQPEDIYMSESQIRDLVDSGMHVGSHSVTHTAMSKLSVEDQRQEITNSFNFLSEFLCGTSVRSYCHPYGGPHSYHNETISLLKGTGYLFGFDVDSRPITASIIRNERYRLPRYDCNDFRHGSATVSLG